MPSFLTKPLCSIPSLSTIFILFVFTLLAGKEGVSADIPFQFEVITDSSPTSPWEKAMADINGDGKKDMIVGGPTGPVIWYAYPDWTPTTIAGSGSYNSACGIAVGDIDNDGDQDVVMGGIRWFENPLPEGNPFIGNWTSHIVGDHRSHDIAIADLDKDGKLDIISRNQGGAGNVVYIFKQESPDSWVRKSIPAVSGEGLTLGDFDNDGDTDIAIPKQWYENTGDIEGGSWNSYEIAPSFNQVAVLKSSDINLDGRIDVVVSASENVDIVAWYECPADPKNQTWTEHQLGINMDSVHGLGVADFDGDGDMDIAASEFRGDGRLILFLNENLNGTNWVEQVLGTQQLHNIVVDDYDGDGDFDIFGTYCWNNPPAYLWSNESGPYLLGLEDWSYLNIDDSRSRQYFGLAMGDGNGDGYSDIASGRYFYLNPGDDLSGTWQRTSLPVESDANFIVDIDGDQQCDIIAQALPDIYWFEAVDSTASSFQANRVATGIAATGHGSSQGYAVGEIVGGGKEEIVLTSGGGIYFLQIPPDPSSGDWPVVNITSNAPEEGISIGDIDNDGDNDVAAWIGTGSGSHLLGWWENPGDGSGDWAQYSIGSTVSEEGDRVEVVDINKDGRNDIVVTETNNGASGNSLHWFECPPDPKTVSTWTRHTVASNLGGLNSMDVRDMNNDGFTDIITGEHRGEKRVVIWENIEGGSGSWISHLVDSGKESHLGSRTGDLDNDGDYDIVSICWDDYPKLHVWRNDAKTSPFSGDETPPSLVAVRATRSPNMVKVEFNEPVSVDSAANITNYTISGDIAVLGAVLQDDEKTVILSVEELTPEVTYSLTVDRISDIRGNILISGEQMFTYTPFDPGAGLIGYWPFDEGAGNTASDVSGNSYDGILQNGALWARGYFNSCIDLDGEDDYVALPNIDVSGNTITLSAWIRSDLLSNCGSNDCRIISKSTGTSENDHYWMLSTIKVGESTRLRFRLKTGSATTTLIANSGNLSDKAWAHAVAVYDGEQMRLYKDAELVGATAKTGELATDSSVEVNIGRNPDAYGAWDGMIDDVRIFNRALTDTEIRGLYVGSTPDAGDVNYDNNVGLLDLLICLQTISGKTVKQQIFPEADVDGDDKLGIPDAIYILRMISGL